MHYLTTCVFVCFIQLVVSYHLSNLLLIPQAKIQENDSKNPIAQNSQREDDSFEIQHSLFLEPQPTHRHRHFFHRNGRSSRKRWRDEHPSSENSLSTEIFHSMESDFPMFELDVMLKPKAKPIHPHKIRHKHKHRQVQNEENGMAKLYETKRNPGMVFRITKKAVDFVLNKGKKFVEEDLTGRPVSEFNLMVLEQLNVTVHAIKIANLEFPEVNYEKLSRDTIKLSTCGGHLELRGLYRSVYQTIREGQFKAIVTGFETNLKIKITRTLDGKLKLQDKVCSSSIVRVEIELQPNLIDDVSEEIRIHLIDMLNTKICNYVGEYIDKIDQKLANMLKMSSIQLESKENKIQFDGKMLNDVMLEGEYFDLALAGEFLRSNKRAPFQPEIIVKHESDAEKMVYLYLSEYAINSFFYQIDSYAFFRINLHRIPEIESLLRLNCDASEDCLGRYFEWKNLFEPNSGRMEARPITCPSIEISEEGALLKLNLTVDIGYQKVGAKARTVIMGFNLLLEIMINSVDIKSVDAPKIMKRSISPSRLYQIQPQVSIKEMKVSSIKSYVEQIEDFSQDFDSYVYTRRELIEEMLNKNFHKIFSLPNKFPIEAQHISINFRRKTVMIGFDLKLDSTRSFFLHGKK